MFFELDFGYDYLFREVIWELVIWLCEIVISDIFWWMYICIIVGKVDCVRLKDVEQILVEQCYGKMEFG